MASRKYARLGVAEQGKLVEVNAVSRPLADIWPTAASPIDPHTQGIILQNVGAVAIRYSMGGDAPGPADVASALVLPVNGSISLIMRYPTMMAMEFWAAADCEMNVILEEIT